MANYEVVVGNIGKVYEGGFYDSALDNFFVYKHKSQQDTGRASGEPVTILKDGEILREYLPDTEEEESPTPSPENTSTGEPVNTALLETLRALTDWAREHTSPTDPNSPHEILIRAVAVIDKADKQKQDDRLQLLRLLDEAHAVLTLEQLEEMAVSMDQEPEDVKRSLVAATSQFEQIKDAVIDEADKQKAEPTCEAHTLTQRAIAAFWSTLEAEYPRTMYHGLDAATFNRFVGAAYAAAKVRLGE